jgi:hypothetical protein
MIPYFQHKYGDQIKVFFNKDAWEMHKDTYWDQEANAAVTPDDQLVQDIVEQDLEYQWEELQDEEDDT